MKPIIEMLNPTLTQGKTDCGKFRASIKNSHILTSWIEYFGGPKHVVCA